MSTSKEYALSSVVFNGSQQAGRKPFVLWCSDNQQAGCQLSQQKRRYKLCTVQLALSLKDCAYPVAAALQLDVPVMGIHQGALRDAADVRRSLLLCPPTEVGCGPLRNLPPHLRLQPPPVPRHGHQAPRGSRSALEVRHWCAQAPMGLC